MLPVRRTLGASLLSLLTCNLVLAQEAAPSRTASTSGPAVAMTSTAERVRFTAPGDVVRLHVQVFSESGQSLFDVDSKGNVFDWTLQDGSGQRVGDGVYLCVVTVKSLSGSISQRIGTVSLQGNAVTLQAAQSGQMTAAQQDAVGPVEANGSLTVLPESETPAVTVLTHDGQDGQVTSTTGSLTFRTGDLFTAFDRERMRITPEGLVGIGTETPQATLDVAGTIRARGGIAFEDGTVLTSSKGDAGSAAAPGSVGPLVSGTGTPNRMPKWLDAVGTLVDSSVTENAGRVGIGTADPGALLHIFGGATQDVFAGMGPDVVAGPAFNMGYAGSSFGRGAGFFNVRPDASAVAPNPSLRFATANVQRMIINNTGNVGIGTIAPVNNEIPAFHVVQNGTGRAGLFVVTGTTGGSAAVRAESASDGSAISSLMTGTSRAGNFVISNAANPAVVLEGNTNGTGGGLLLNLTNAANAAAVLNAATTGTGSGAVFNINNVANTNPVLQATTTGTGFSAAFTGGAGVSVVGGMSVSGISNHGSLNAAGSISAGTTLSVGTLAAATATPVCINGTTLATCSSSIRYKTDVTPYRSGLGVVSKLQPVNFRWKDREERDLGFIAEHVNEVEPILSTVNDRGQVEGVKYDQLSAVLVNAIKEQQRQIERLQAEVTELRRRGQR